MLSPVLITLWMHKHNKVELFSPYPYMLSAAISMVISLKEHKFQFQFSTNTHEELAKIMFFGYVAMTAVSIAVVPLLGVVGFLWTWLIVEVFQMVLIMRLNMKLFAEIEALELTFLWRLVGICVPALLVSLLLLQKTTSYSMVWQIAIAIAAGGVVAGVAWPLFGVGEVIRMINGQFSRKFGSPVPEKG
jgi:hypothetical protein